MPSFNEGYAGLARLLGRANGAFEGTIVISSPSRPLIARRQVAEAMSAAMVSGDVDGVVAALSLLVAPAGREGAPRRGRFRLYDRRLRGLGRP